MWRLLDRKKMKKTTETEIAKELIKNTGCDVDIHREQKIHKQTCQRFLKWLYENYDYFNDLDCEKEIEYIKKIQDLKQTIKIYEDAGI